MIAAALAFLIGNWQRLAVYGMTLLLILGAAWGHGYVKGSAKLADYKVEQAREAVKIVIKQSAVTTRVVTRYIKVKVKTDAAAAAVAKEITDYAISHPGTCLDADWRRLHDGAASNTLPGAAGGTAGKRRAAETSSGTGPPAGDTPEASLAPYASTALATVTANYAGCHRTADRLDSLQEWVRDQGKVK